MNCSSASLVRALTGLGALAASLLPLHGAQAQEDKDILSAAGQCFRASYKAERGDVRDIRIFFERSVSKEPGQEIYVDLNYSYWDVPNETYGMTANCSSNGREIICGIECDGGRLRLQLAEDGRLLAEAIGLRTDAHEASKSLLPDYNGADGLVLNNIFALERTGPADSSCNFDPQTTFVALQAGDLSPRVAILEAKLNQLGHLLEFPDEVFDEVTSAAVKSFQSQYRLADTGIVDEPTARAIESVSLTNLGGC